MQNDQNISGDAGDSSQHRLHEGEELTFVRVRFPGNTRSFPFLTGKRKFAYGQKVVAMSDRGLDVGYINSFPYQAAFQKSMLPIRTISKVASKEDLEKQQSLHQKEIDAEACCKEWVERLGLEMNITHVESIQFGRKMVFYYNAPARVNFRELVKKLVAELHIRIELRQISIRDRAAAIGSIGPCGLMTCCSSFLQSYGNVSIKMAKNQNLALVPSKLNGACGQLKCCIKYEDQVYKEKRQNLPKSGSLIQTASGDQGKVTQLHLMNDQFDMLTDQGQLRRYTKEQYLEGGPYPENDRFPETFEHISIENKDAIGAPKPAPQPPTRRNTLNDTPTDKPESEEEEKPQQTDDEQLDEEELEEDLLALKKAQSLTLEEQERASQQQSGHQQTRPKHHNNKSRRPFNRGNKRHFNKGTRRTHKKRG